MALNVGFRLGHYDVTALIGEGGMGQVWQATDTTLDAPHAGLACRLARGIKFMSDEQLRQSLTELRSELERLEAEEAEVRERLDALIAGIETRLDAPGDIAHHHSLVRDLRRSTLQLEVSHPRATAILDRIMATLGNIGT